jgi:hypothetical protein
MYLAMYLGDKIIDKVSIPNNKTDIYSTILHLNIKHSDKISEARIKPDFFLENIPSGINDFEPLKPLKKSK